MSLFTHQFRSHNIVLSLDAKKNLLKIKVNPQQIEQIIVSLLSNARYALDEMKNLSLPDHKMQLNIEASRDKK